MSYTKNLETTRYVLFLTSEFSQWYPSEFVSKEGHHFNCAEQFMMYQKALLFGDHETAAKILKAETPDEHKKFGREVKNFDREVWDFHARDIVYQGNRYKFTQNPHLWNVLLKTGTKSLVEAAHYDPVWGIGLRADDPRAADMSQWQGKNWLGETLTKLREDLKREGFQPVYTDENRVMFTMYDVAGQRMFYISASELGRQWGNLKMLTEDSESTVISIQFKGKKESLSEKLAAFLERNREAVSLFNPSAKGQIQASRPDFL